MTENGKAPKRGPVQALLDADFLLPRRPRLIVQLMMPPRPLSDYTPQRPAFLSEWPGVWH